MLSNETPHAAASISYFSLVALFPAILIVVALADAFFGWMELHDTVRLSILALFPGSRGFLASNLRELTDPSPPIVLSCLLIVGWSSTWIFLFLEKALNRAWGVPKRRTFLQSRLLSFALLTLCGMLLLSASGITATVSAIRAAADAKVPEFAHDQIIGLLWSSVLFAAGLGVTILVFFLIYKLLPDRRIRGIEALSGALVSAVLWEGASYVFAMLVPLFNYQRVYGRMSALVALLVWVYTSSLIILYGAHYSAELYRGVPGQKMLFPHFAGGQGAVDVSRKSVQAFTRYR